MDGNASSAAEPGATRHLFTVDDVLRMIEAGILPEKARVVLRTGELIDMPSEGARHSNVKSDLIQLVSAQSYGRYRVGADTPLRLTDHDWPEPDLFVLPANIRPAEARGPDTLLVVEVADTSLADDLGYNATLYAKHGVREYWVLDLVNAIVHVHTLLADGTYGAPQKRGVDEGIAAALAQGVSVKLADIL
jgi:Uma2 family endonuclease